MESKYQWYDNQINSDLKKKKNHQLENSPLTTSKSLDYTEKEFLEAI